MAASDDKDEEFTPGVPEINGHKREISETKRIIPEKSERSKAIKERPRNGELRQMINNGAIGRSISHCIDRHVFSYKFSVFNLGETKSRAFQRYFNTECELLLTSWFCEMLFKKAADDRTACIIFNLKRIDVTRGFVKVSVALDVKDVTNNLCLFYKPCMQRQAVYSGQFMDMYLIRIFRTPEEASHFNLKLYVHLVISVLTCHNELDVVCPIWCQELN